MPGRPIQEQHSSTKLTFKKEYAYCDFPDCNQLAQFECDLVYTPICNALCCHTGNFRGCKDKVCYGHVASSSRNNNEQQIYGPAVSEKESGKRSHCVQCEHQLIKSKRVNVFRWLFIALLIVIISAVTTTQALRKSQLINNRPPPLGPPLRPGGFRNKEGPPRPPPRSQN